MNNEKNLSRNRKGRIEKKVDGNIKILLKKIKTEKKKTKILIKIKN